MRRVLTAAAAAALALCTAVPASAATPTPAKAATSPWTRQVVPFPSTGKFGALFSVSCPSAANCMGVGAFSAAAGPQSQDHLLAEHWNGSTWTAKEVPSPSGRQQSEFNGVSCPSATDCIAVGDYMSQSLNDMPVAARWNGTRWSVQPITLPSGETGELTGVSCTSTTRCTAVGDTQKSSTTAQTLAVLWNGHTWVIQSTPNPPGSAYAYLKAVSCASAKTKNCTAIGGTNSRGTRMFAEQWDGSAWTITSTVDPSGARYDELDGISCATAVSCTAVGYYYRSLTGRQLMLAEHWNGQAWSLEPTPTGVYADQEMVSCPSATWCTAVGTRAISNSAALAEVWDGSTWTTQTTATPANRNYFGAISCPAVGSCTAVGGSAGAPAGFTPILAEQE